MARAVQDIVQAIAANRKTFNGQAEAIRKDTGLNPEGRNSALKTAYDKAMVIHDQLLAERKGNVDSEAERTRIRAFGPLGKSILDHTALREAIARTETRKDLGVLLQQAIVTSDPVLMRAVAVVSLKNGEYSRLVEIAKHDGDLANWLVAEKARGNKHLNSNQEKVARAFDLNPPERPLHLPNY